MKKEAEVWFMQAEEYFGNMEFLFENSRYSLSVYCAHQALEMILKAAIVEVANKIPPKSHNLDHLLELSELKPSDITWYEELASITKHFWRVRYPDFQKYVYTTKKISEPTVIKTREIYLWVKNKLPAI